MRRSSANGCGHGFSKLEDRKNETRGMVSQKAICTYGGPFDAREQSFGKVWRHRFRRLMEEVVEKYKGMERSIGSPTSNSPL